MRKVTFQTGVNILGMPNYTTHTIGDSKNKYGKNIIITNSEDTCNK